MTYSPSTIANYFLERATQEARAITPMQLNKLVYLAHGWNLGYTGKPLISETVKAWRYGPIIVSVYKKTKRFGSGGVLGLISSGHWFSQEQNIEADDLPLLDKVWTNYARFSGLELSHITHTEDSPWAMAWRQVAGNKTAVQETDIDNALIASFYREQIQKHATNQPSLEIHEKV